jgi:hypothetical protein
MAPESRWGEDRGSAVREQSESRCNQDGYGASYRDLDQHVGITEVVVASVWVLWEASVERGKSSWGPEVARHHSRRTRSG